MNSPVNIDGAAPKRYALFHNLMYSTAYLLLICGIPGAALTGVFFFLSGEMAGWDAAQFATVLIALELAIAGILHAVALRITQQQSRHE